MCNQHNQVNIRLALKKAAHINLIAAENWYAILDPLHFYK